MLNGAPSSYFDPHGYQPLIVDESCLSDSDSREALLDSFYDPHDWNGALTAMEMGHLEKQVLESESSKSPLFFGPGESAKTQELRFVAARKGTHRAYARDKYNEGRRIWYGDVPPWL
jgi:hypothetical protein